jgi:hypothetical protein
LSDAPGSAADGRAAVTLSFDNLGEVTDLQRGLWPPGEPLGRHFSVTRALPRILALLDELDLRATFFVEGRNTELYPDTLAELAAGGHEVAYHGWCHEHWADLPREREAELLERGVKAMGALGLRPLGFRPPGGRLTASSVGLLRDLGFTHCSPAGEGAGVRTGVAILPFRWAVLDAYHYLPRFAGLRARERAAADPLPPAGLRATLDAALRDAVAARGHLALVFHPFLADAADRVAIMRRTLEDVRARADAGVVWCAPHRDVAAALRDGCDGAFGELRLDDTPV